MLNMMSVDSAGVGFGTKLSYEGFSLVATGFYASWSWYERSTLCSTNNAS